MAPIAAAGGRHFCGGASGRCYRIWHLACVGRGAAHLCPAGIDLRHPITLLGAHAFRRSVCLPSYCRRRLPFILSTAHLRDYACADKSAPDLRFGDVRLGDGGDRKPARVDLSTCFPALWRWCATAWRKLGWTGWRTSGAAGEGSPWSPSSISGDEHARCSAGELPELHLTGLVDLKCERGIRRDEITGVAGRRSTTAQHQNRAKKAEPGVARRDKFVPTGVAHQWFMA